MRLTYPDINNIHKERKRSKSTKKEKEAKRKKDYYYL